MFERFYFKIFNYVMLSAREGLLELRLPTGKGMLYGDVTARPLVVSVSDWDFFKQVIRGAGIGLGESYTAGLWNTSQLTDFLCFLIKNKKYFDSRLRLFRGMNDWVNSLSHRQRKNTVKNSPKNIQDHYDLSNDFFSLFLDPSMTYSSAIFEQPEDTLETAQRNKIRRLAQSIGINQNDHVLEIGCGWGAFAIQTVQETGCRWTGLTLSVEQKAWAEAKIAEAGLSEQIEIKLLDYRHAKGAYDKIISVEMIEAVGHEFLKDFFQICARLLRAGGKMALQGIVIPHERYDQYRRGCDWLQKYIFPGGHLPSLEILQKQFHAANLELASVGRIGAHYARTLELWREALQLHERELRALGCTDAFIRKWNYYFCYCEAGFRSRFIDAVQIVLEKGTV